MAKLPSNIAKALDAYPPNVVALAAGAREFVLESLPGAAEVLDTSRKKASR